MISGMRLHEISRGIMPNLSFKMCAKENRRFVETVQLTLDYYSDRSQQQNKRTKKKKRFYKDVDWWVNLLLPYRILGHTIIHLVRLQLLPGGCRGWRIKKLPPKIRSLYASYLFPHLQFSEFRKYEI